MTTAGSEYRLDGIYKQRQDGYYMQRVKLAAGVISSLQARTVASVSARFGQGTIHLTTRGSMEIHWIKEESLSSVKRELGRTGLTSRGACGGAVRGITTGSQGTQGFPALESLARRLHRHFTGNPRFERLPKKFKIGIEADVVGGRHLIQDVGLVLARLDGGHAWYDIWIAGGLGREPQPAFLLQEQVPEERVIPIIEAVVRVYATHAPPPRRLKFLAKEYGEDTLRQLIRAEPVFNEALPETTGLSDCLAPESVQFNRLILPVFAGRITAEQLLAITDIADIYADGVLMVTENQDIALHVAADSDYSEIVNQLHLAMGLASTTPSPALRVCPGSHECLMGLAATRDVAQDLLDHMDESGHTLTWALSGCPNSCSQPQLADVGIVAARLTADSDGGKSPRFDLYRRTGAGFGQKVQQELTRLELLDRLGALSHD